MITKEAFYKELEDRFRRYREAIPSSGDGAFIRSMFAIGNGLIADLRRLDHQFDLFGDGNWGYGVNYIHNGVEEYKNVEVDEIKKINELNKHHKYNLFWLLIFKINSVDFTYHVFCMDLCGGGLNSDINLKLQINNLKNISLKNRGKLYYLDLHFNLSAPFSFQLDNHEKYAAHYKKMFEEVIQGKEESYNICINDGKQHNLFKIGVDEVNILADSFNSNTKKITISGAVFQLEHIKSIKIFLITDMTGLNNELASSGRLHPTAKKMYDIGNWRYERFLKYGSDLTSKFLKAKSTILLNNETNLKIIIENIDSIIEKGEGKKIEFKSSLRWDIKEQKTAKIIESIIIKAMAAFLNSNGGNLLIGIEDNGNVLGLDYDFNSFKGSNKKDEFRKHFDNLIGNYFGNNFARLVDLNFLEVKEKTIAIVSIPHKASKPVYIKEDSKEVFYIRREASSISLTVSESVNYIKEHWN